MFHIEKRRTRVSGAFELLELIFHAAVRNVRKSHGNAVLGLLINIFQTVLMVGVFYIMFDLLNLRRLAIRGDFLLYVMSGVFLFMTHTKTVGAVSNAEGPTSPMMKHAPMNTIVAIAGAALSALYLQLLSAALVLYFYHAAIKPLEIFHPVGVMGVFLMSWFTGVAIGMVLLAARPWAPDLVGMVTLIYQRVNMIASGKMFVVNMLPGWMIALFDWNPLFHCIDQARGEMFLNYTPHHTSMSYPFYVALSCLMIGLMAEFYTRRHASVSWGAGR
ncbi:ABC-type polysaccharide/polyol phosphate export permease [Gemmobacter megaterium]|uniref:ABC-type polysaccharide/polyol phosphate export permease n=1 Tax=Gemmobacter megaterium TaxID=1086013 RepID=A0A1N7NZI6_9RHOB|nr:ABC transporter permease [Gemmobacter megaterium]GGE15554.1 ABC transporter permease [Gemmobacter megaterium]SIT03775.1 ABC-type polysaccharide/polyol phosphate export permease [Gemmobacter megaterium]